MIFVFFVSFEVTIDTGTEEASAGKHVGRSVKKFAFTDFETGS